MKVLSVIISTPKVIFVDLASVSHLYYTYFFFLFISNQVWHKPGEHHPVRAEHRYSSHCRPGVTVRVCRRGSSLASNIWYESGVS